MERCFVNHMKTDYIYYAKVMDSFVLISEDKLLPGIAEYFVSITGSPGK